MEKEPHVLHMTLGRNVRAARERLGFTQQHIAERADLSTGHISDLEQGRKWVTAESLQRLADALMVEPWMLLLPDDPRHKGTADYELLTRFASRVRAELNTAVGETLQELLSGRQPPPAKSDDSDAAD